MSPGQTPRSVSPQLGYSLTTQMAPIGPSTDLFIARLIISNRRRRWRRWRRSSPRSQRSNRRGPPWSSCPTGPNRRSLVVAQQSSAVCERKCAKAGGFDLHRCANLRAFVLSRGRRDNGTVGVIVVCGDGGDQCDVHRGRRRQWQC
jgi:hypothetical protein